MDVKVVCPQCGLNDKIEKVSAVVYSQTHEASSYSLEANTWTHQTSILAQLLKKPEVRVRATGAIIGPYRTSVLGELGFYLNILLFSGFGICFILFSLFTFFMGIKQISENASYLLLGFIPALMGVGFMAFTIYYYKSSQAKLKNAEDEYDKTVRIWNRLYYCYRDDIVFDPTNNKVASPNEIHELYYSS